MIKLSISNLPIPESCWQVLFSMSPKLFKKIKIHKNFYLQIKKNLPFFLLNLLFLNSKNKIHLKNLKNHLRKLKNHLKNLKNHLKKLKSHLRKKISDFLIDLQKKWQKNLKENLIKKLKIKHKIECNCQLLIEIIQALLAIKALINPLILLSFLISAICPKISVIVSFIPNLGIYDIQSSATLQKSILVFSVPKAPRFGSGPKYAG